MITGLLPSLCSLSHSLPPSLQFQYGPINSTKNGNVEEGVIFATYSSLIGESRSGGQKKTRFDQLVNWLGANFDGIVSKTTEYSYSWGRGGGGAGEGLEGWSQGYQYQARFSRERKRVGGVFLGGISTLQEKLLLGYFCFVGLS